MTNILYQHSQYAAVDCSNKTNVMINYHREIGYQGDLKISRADVKVWKPNRNQRKLKKINMVQ